MEINSAQPEGEQVEAPSREVLAMAAACWIAPIETADGRPADRAGSPLGHGINSILTLAERLAALPLPFLSAFAAVPETSTELAVRDAIANLTNRQWLQLQPGTAEADAARRAIGDTLAIIDILDAIIATQNDPKHNLWPAAHSNAMQVRQSYADRRTEPRIYPRGVPEHGYVMGEQGETAKFRAFAMLWLIECRSVQGAQFGDEQIAFALANHARAREIIAAVEERRVFDPRALAAVLESASQPLSRGAL